MRDTVSRVAVGVLGLVAIVFVTWSTRDTIDSGLAAVGAAAILILNLLMVLVVLRRVLSHGTVTLQTLYGAACAYVLIGLAFGSLYSFVDSVGSALVFGRPVNRAAYSYFSFMTLTTTGYGDYTPQTALAQRIAVVEAVTGELFVAMTIAGLVALYIRGNQPDN